MIIYNLFPLLAGKFTAWEEHLLRASEMGFNWVFVNPLQRPGKSGSLYSIADYYDFNPVLVDKKSKKNPQEQAKEMIQKAENLGLKVMVDLVINHCSLLIHSVAIKGRKWFGGIWQGSITRIQTTKLGCFSFSWTS
jgi:starch synthase (maltosyl-transferring)